MTLPQPGLTIMPRSKQGTIHYYSNAAMEDRIERIGRWIEKTTPVSVRHSNGKINHTFVATTAVRHWYDTKEMPSEADLRRWLLVYYDVTLLSQGNPKVFYVKTDLKAQISAITERLKAGGYPFRALTPRLRWPPRQIVTLALIRLDELIQRDHPGI